MTNSRLANHLIFWTLIVAIFVVPVGMLVSDLSSGDCHYSCSRK